MARIFLALPHQNLAYDVPETAAQIIDQIEKKKILTVMVEGQKRYYATSMVYTIEETTTAEPTVEETPTAEETPEVPAETADSKPSK